ncbi:glutamate receptor ionotropic, kainate 2 isoform X2 [Ooceraea biroi]|uniref:Glutamate receptor, ionotropic kainate n=1 Tax=Ooceraea biroi TaxID=2015173 RepID=A0A026WFJ3_OOCBI|nr:glutamate receptor ionotropic, kainate 2 isoform X2 [Ooceraea biroi]EZA54693.1 Glutamate receptor, ionotropic kainate [Ooceraea biroi]
MRQFIGMDMRRRFFLVATTLLAFAVHGVHGVARPIKVGAIFHKGDEDLKFAFERAIYDTRYEHLAPAFKLIPVIAEVDVDTDSFNTATATCELLQEGVVAIFGPASPHTRGIVTSITTRFDVPHIEYVWRENEKIKNPSSMTINVYPDSELLSQAIAAVVDSMNLPNFVVIYETDEGLSRIQKILTLKRKKDSSIIVRQLGEGPDYRPVLKEIQAMKVCNVIIDIDPHKIVDVLNQAKQVKLLADYCNFIITYLDSSKLPIFEIRNGTTANITAISLRETDHEEIKWLDSAILYDAVFLFNKALETLNARSIDYEDPDFIYPLPISCNDGMKYQAGPNITSVMRELSKMGKITGIMSIDEYGHRDNFKIYILNFRQPGNPTQIGFWMPNSGDVQLMQTKHEIESYLYKSIQDKHFKISTRVGAPYIIEVTDDQSRGILIDQKRYEGYCIDLIDEIAKQLGFKYTFELEPKNKYGTYDEKTKTWDGLIRRLLDHEADLAICDLTITYQRESAVDFSMPFMNLGISILFSKPEEKVPLLFSFLSPLSVDVWMYMATAYLIVSLMLFLQARIAPGEWDNPHPCNDDPEELENNFNLKNSMWLTIGSLMQQGSDILPKAPSIRMLAGMWWFFTLIMISSYTANLAAFLTAEKMDTPIKNVEDLAKQTKIKYGALKGGSTSTFFRDSNYSTYKRMWNTMVETKPSVFTKDNEDGVDRVVKEKRQYAFLMESTSIEYKMERNCEIDKIGGLIDNKGYGIALPRNSPYRTPINRAILTLGEKGTLQQLKKKWWQEIGGGQCKKADADKNANTSELRLANVGGVFLVLMCGCGASLIIAICEFLWNVRKVAVREKITPWEALVAELKFAVNIWAVTKPVKIIKSRSASSMEGGHGRAASTARSIVGSFLRLDILDKFDKDAKTNNRSNDRKIN